jgi:uncharacterized protein involved in outer membrane biogenesis
MSRWKKILIAAALLIIILCVAIYAFLSLYDFNKLKPTIAKAVKDATGRELNITGNIEIELGLRPTVVVEGASFQNASWSSTPNLAQVKRLEVQIAFWPLILGKFDFARLVLVEPDVIVEFDDNGTSNFSFNISGKTSGKTSVKQKNESALSPPPLIFTDVLIENGRFTYRDAQSDLKFSIRIDRLTADIPGFDKSLQINFKGAFDDLPFTLNGTVGPIWAWVEKGYVLPANVTVTADGATADVKGEIRDPTRFKDLGFTIAAQGTSTAAIAKLAGLTDIPELGAFKLTANVADPQGSLAVEKLDLQIGSETLVAVSITGDIKNVPALQGFKLDVTAQGRDVANLTRFGLPPLPAGKGPFKVTADISNPQTNVFTTGNLSVTLGDYEINGPVTFNLAEKVPFLTAELISQKSELGPGSLNLKLIDPFGKPAIKKLDLKLGTPELAEIRLKGTVDDLLELQGANFKFRTKGKDLANLRQLTGQPLPVQGAFSAAGKILIPVRNHLEIPDLKIVAGKNDISGSLDLDLREGKSEVTAALSSPQLDLPSVLLPELAGKGWAKGLVQVRPVKLAVKLADFFKEAAVKEVDLQAGTPGSAELRLNGSVGNLAALRGVDLNFSLQGKELAKLKEILAQPYLFAPLPGQGAYALSGNISDQAADVFNVSNFKFVLAENELTGRLNFNLAARPPQYEVDLSGPKFNMKPFPIPKEAAYANLNKIDDLGPLKIHSQVIVTGGELSLSQFELQAGREQLAMLQAKGSIKDLTTQSGIDLHFEIHGNEVANLEKITGRPLPLKGAYALSGQLTDPAQKDYKISDLALKLGPNDISGWLDLNRNGQQLQLSTELASPKFTLQSVTLPAIEKISRLEDLGPLKLTLNLAGAGDKLALDNLDLMVGSEDIIKLLLKGTIKDLSAMQGLNLAFTVNGQDISKLIAVGGPKIPSKDAFRISARLVDPAPQIYKLSDIDAALGDSQSSGWLELDSTGQRPQLKAELSSDKLDLRQFSKQAQSSGEAEAQTADGGSSQENKMESKEPPSESGAKKDKIFPADPLPLADLQRIDIDLKYRGKQVLFRSMAFNDLVVDILLRDGSLDIKPLKFTIGGGSANGWINLHSRKKPAEVSTSLTINQMGIGPMLDQLEYTRSIEGNLDAMVDLDGSGDSIAALMAGLNGDIRIALKDGKTESRYFDLLEKYIGSGILQMINPFKKQSQYTPINCFVDTVKIDDGKADVKLLLDTDQTSIFGAGTINLKTESLDLGIKPTPKKTALPADISFSLNQLSQPFRLGGTLADPHLAFDPGRTAFLLGKLAGALALGPIGIAAFFADISLGKKDACAVALDKAMKKIEASETKNSGETPQKTGADNEKQKEKKSPGFFKKLFGK